MRLVYIAHTRITGGINYKENEALSLNISM